MRFQAQRGTEDVLPSQSYRWRRLEQTFRELVHRYGYKELRTPTFEDTQLFVRTSGETSDIVTKQMYSFFDKGERNITLKPEGTAPAMRALIEAGLLQPNNVQKVYYVTPIFRYERPQKGRLREAHQVGLELVGSTSAQADAEVIEITVRFYEALGLKDVVVKMNSIGRDDCRAAYRAAILEFAKDYLATQSEEAVAKIQKNPLRLLDSKDDAVIEFMAKAPSILDYLEPDSKARFEEVQRLLALAGIRFEVCPEIVRGLDYYTETVFEVHSESIGAQSALCGGGRYDNLVKELGGPDMPSVGVAMGVERALLTLEAEGLQGEEDRPDLFVIATDSAYQDQALAIARAARERGFAALTDLDGRSIKSQLKAADRANCRYAVILGEDEAAAGKVTLRNLSDSNQVLVSLEEALEALR